MIIPTHVEQYLLSESSRQSALVEPMIRAYEIASTYEGILTESFILDLASCFGFTWYRTTPVTFAAGGHAANAHVIPDTMTRLIENAPRKETFRGWYLWVYSFLRIHPFQDGNGRIASLLLNWGVDTLEEPFPLPYYQF